METDTLAYEFLHILLDIGSDITDETPVHMQNVAKLSYFLAEKHPDVDEQMTQMILEAAMIHDIGKIKIPQTILHKTTPLTFEEFETIKTHTTKAYAMLQQSSHPLLVMARDIAHEHHEFYNGLGYPQRLKGDYISLPARIVAVADVYDSIANKKGAFGGFGSHQEAKETVLSNRGIQFDPMIVDIFEENYQEIIDAIYL
jgi:HD-GYP domain-containing protein (c-di-GMP phosphodiesterase class II)